MITNKDKKESLYIKFPEKDPLCSFCEVEDESILTFLGIVGSFERNFVYLYVLLFLKSFLWCLRMSYLE